MGKQLSLIKNQTISRKLSRAEFRRRAEEIFQFLQSEYEPFKDDSPEIQRRRRLRAQSDPFYFFRTYLPHYFKHKFAPFHYELVGLLERRPVIGDTSVVEPVAVAAPREFAKTTITSFGYVLHQICFKLRHFIIIGSDTQDLASDITAYLYLELCYNERIRHDFGNLVKENWDSDDFVTLNDVRLKARGRGQRMRGLKHKQHRPDLVILDDLENEDSARSKSRVKLLLQWISRTIYNCIDSKGNLFIIGTLLSKLSALGTITGSKEEPWCYWHRRTYQAITKEGESLWPDKYPMEILQEQKRLMGSIAFAQEKMNLPTGDDSYFQPEWIQYYSPEDIYGKPLIAASWFDASIEAGATHDMKAIITVGIDKTSGSIYVLDAYLKKNTLEICLQQAIEIYILYKPLVFGIEDNVFQKLLVKEFDRVATERKIPIPTKGVGNYIAKEARIASLSPLVERGKLLFRKDHSDQNELVDQLLHFPSKHAFDDGPDALEGAVRLAREFAIGVATVTVQKADNYHGYGGRHAQAYIPSTRRSFFEIRKAS